MRVVEVRVVALESAEENEKRGCLGRRSCEKKSLP